jgi:hypothetical protein
MKRHLALLALLAGCSHAADVVTAYPASRTESGAVEVVLNDPTRAMSVTINDQLVVDHKETRKAHVDGIPPGTAHIRVATGGRCEHGNVVDQDVEIIAGQTSTVALAGPEPGLGCMIFSGLDSIAGEVGAIAIALALGGATVVKLHH